MQTIATIGLDIAKSVFQVHGVDATGQVVVRRQLKRRPLSAASCLWSVDQRNEPRSL
jgi:transposase